LGGHFGMEGHFVSRVIDKLLGYRNI